MWHSCKARFEDDKTGQFSNHQYHRPDKAENNLGGYCHKLQPVWQSAHEEDRGFSTTMLPSGAVPMEQDDYTSRR